MRRKWTDDEIETVRLNYANWPCWLIAHLVNRSEGAVYRLADKLGLKKADDFFASLYSGRLRTDDPRGATTRFPKGHEPANKGVRRPGYAPGRMASTQFRKGERRGVAVELYKPIGSLRITKDGTLQRKVHDGLPLQSRWKAVHHLVWEAVNGPVPPGHVVVFKDRKRTNVEAEITAERLECISRADNARRNAMWNRYPREAAEVMQLTGALKRKINRRKADVERRA